MAANFWESTQRRFWQFSKDELAQLRLKLENDNPQLVQDFPLPQWRHINIFVNQQLSRLGKRLAIRQQVLATAQTYIKRFYCKVEIRRTNPYLLMATALYLACKMEEAPQHIKFIVQEARVLWPDFISQDTSRLGECEFFLISEMSAQMIVHQPYRTLTQLQSDFSLTQDECSLSTSIINDHYMTDLPLLHPPHVIALTAILLSLVLRPTAVSGTNASNMTAAAAALAQAQGRPMAALVGGITGGGSPSPLGAAGDGTRTPQPQQPQQQDPRAGKLQRFAAFLAESNVDVEAMIDSTQELISFYECHEQYVDKSTREQIGRCVKANFLDKV